MRKSSKLSLNKVVISNLTNRDLSNVKGGGDTLVGPIDTVVEPIDTIKNPGDTLVKTAG